MTITSTFVELVQAKAMSGIITSYIYVTLLISFIFGLFGTMLICEEESKWRWKLFFKLFVISFVILALIMGLSSLSNYKLWRDFPIQMIIDKLT